MVINFFHSYPSYDRLAVTMTSTDNKGTTILGIIFGSSTNDSEKGTRLAMQSVNEKRLAIVFRECMFFYIQFVRLLND